MPPISLLRIGAVTNVCILLTATQDCMSLGTPGPLDPLTLPNGPSNNCPVWMVVPRVLPNTRQQAPCADVVTGPFPGWKAASTQLTQFR